MEADRFGSAPVEWSYSMVQKLLVGGRDVWLKSYSAQPRARRAINRVWNAVAGGLGAEPLRSPPSHAGEQAKQVEMRRIGELRACGVLVPEVLGEGPATLLLSDIGPSLSSRLRSASGPGETDDLVHRTVAEVVAAHRQGGYFGQAFARNITVAADGRIGFIDFEEDPLEVMPLRDAQARDWVMLAAGVSRYYAGRDDALAGMLERNRPQVAGDVADEVRKLASRLGFLHGATRHLGHRARALGMAVLSLRKGFGMLAIGLLIDLLIDGKSDIFNALQSLL